MPLIAKLVYDGGEQIWLPSEMGKGRADQLLGTAAEQLTEAAGRVCYDSCGTGRPSFDSAEHWTIDPINGTRTIVKAQQGFHSHIAAVGHFSVCEHAVFTTAFNDMPNMENLVPALMNRPSLWFESWGKGHMRVTCNLRHVIDWERQGPPYYKPQKRVLYDALRRNAHKVAPHIVAAAEAPTEGRGVLVAPDSPQEKWVSIYMQGSRGFSHEQVRHGDWSAISQRSTRYLDESESEWIQHPLERAFELDQLQNETVAGGINNFIAGGAAVKQVAESVYRGRVEALEPWLVGRGVIPLTARKQARGAARGYLGNALATELIFSASCAQWHWMLQMRASAAADAEIREVYCAALPELQRSRYGDLFQHLKLMPSPDGIGQVVDSA